MGTSVVKNLSDLSPAMRYALTTRNWIRRSTADALVRRGLVTLGDTRPSFGWTVYLTEAGRAARDELLAPLVPGARIRHTEHGKLGRVVRVELGENYDVVTLRWDGWNSDTSGSPAYLEVIAEDEPMHWTERGRPSHSDPTAEQCDEPPMNDLEAEQDQDWRATLTGGCPNDPEAIRAEVDAVVREHAPRSVSAHLRRARVLLTLLGAAEFAGVPDFTGADLHAYGNDVEIQLMSPEHLAPWAHLLGVNRVVVERRDTFVRVAVDATLFGLPVRCWDHLTEYEQGQRMHSWAVTHGVTAKHWTVDSEFSLTVPEYLAALAATRQG